jgi:GNAT superfamily N-acetyltransferase
VIDEMSTTREDLALRAYGVEQMSPILALLQQTLGNHGAVRKSEAFWQWKHHRNPFGHSYGIYSWSEREQRAAGLRVLMRWRFDSPDGRTILAARAVDTATHPDFQRRGIFSTLTRRAIEDLTGEGVHLIFNTPNHKSLPGYLKMKWQIVARWPLYLKILRPLSMIRARLRPQGDPPPLHTADFFGSQILPWSAFAERYADPLADLIPRWEADRPRRGLRTPRTWDYLRWRYGEHPHVDYGFFPFTVGNARDVAGVAILRPNYRYGWREAVLAELLLAEPDARLGQSLLRGLVRQVKADYLVAHFAARTVERRTLWPAGFLSAPGQGITFTVRFLQEEGEPFTAPAAWDLSLGDLEIF